MTKFLTIIYGVVLMILGYQSGLPESASSVATIGSVLFIQGATLIVLVELIHPYGKK